MGPRGNNESGIVDRVVFAVILPEVRRIESGRAGGDGIVLWTRSRIYLPVDGQRVISVCKPEAEPDARDGRVGGERQVEEKRISGAVSATRVPAARPVAR
jgi:hypothetical protein